MTFGLLGAEGGKIKDIVDAYMLAPGQNIEQEEDSHMILAHIITRHMRAVVQKVESYASVEWGGLTMSTIFLDRDGAVNENQSDYVKSWSEFCFLPGPKEAIAILTNAGYRIFVCTNHTGVARGKLSRATVEEIHHHMVAEIAKADGRIERVYYCSHGRAEYCCSKPRSGMLLRERDEFGLDMHDAIFIGDSISDVGAALAAGIQTILVLIGLGIEHLREHTLEANGSFHVAVSLKHIDELIQQELNV